MRHQAAKVTPSAELHASRLNIWHSAISGKPTSVFESRPSSFRRAQSQDLHFKTAGAVERPFTTHIISDFLLGSGVAVGVSIKQFTAFDSAGGPRRVTEREAGIKVTANVPRLPAVYRHSLNWVCSLR